MSHASKKQANHQLNHSQLQYISKNLPIATALNLLLGAILIVMLKDYVTIEKIVFWYAILIFVSLIRIFLSIKYGALLKQNINPEIKSYPYVLILSGLSWGLAPWIIFPYQSEPAQVFLALLLIILISISSTSLSAKFKDVLYYILAVTPLMVIKYAIVATHITIGIAVLSFIFAYVTILNARRISEKFSAEIKLQHKLHQQAISLKQGERELSSLFENSSNALILLSPDGEILRANQKSLETVGLSLDVDVTQFHIYDSPWWKQDEQSIEKLHFDLDQALQGNSIPREISIHLSDGNSIYHQLSISPIYSGDKISYLYMEGKDITNFKLSKMLLEESENRFRALSESAGEYLWEIDANGIYQQVDHQSIAIKGYQPSELIGLSITKTMPKEDQQNFNRIFSSSKMALDSFNFEHRTQSLDGEIIWEKIKATPIFSPQQKLIGYRGASSNITLRKAQQAQLIKAKEDAEAGTRAKSQFLAVMSHEIRTPMNGVIGMAQLLMDTPLNSQQYDYASTIVSSGKSLLQLLNDILDLSKIESGKLELERTDFNIHLLIIEVKDLMSAIKESHNLSMNISIETDVPVYVKGDPTRLRQILVNLIGNAVKFTSQGSITIAVNLIQQTNLLTELEFKVIDTGIGISKNKLETIFETFSQADASTTRKFGGTGLGLSVTRQLIELLGGKIAVDSIEGKGSTFKFSLHFHQLNELSIQSDDPSTLRSDSRVKQILLVEDNLVNQKVASSILKKIGYEVTAVVNGKEAVSYCENFQFDLIFMDCQMPLMDGYEATLAIRAGLSANSKIPIIAMTANAIPGDREKCLEVGMNDYLSKPIDNLSLKTLLKKYT